MHKHKHKHLRRQRDTQRELHAYVRTFYQLQSKNVLVRSQDLNDVEGNHYAPRKMFGSLIRCKQ